MRRGETDGLYGQPSAPLERQFSMLYGAQNMNGGLLAGASDCEPSVVVLLLINVPTVAPVVVVSGTGEAAER